MTENKQINKNVTFFGGAINDRTTSKYSDSVLIGNFLASNGYIIKNGGYSGLMEAVSKGANEAEGTIIGYTCLSIGCARGNEYLTETVPCIDIYQRLRLLISDSEIFIVQIGGIGTLSEVFLLLDGIRKLKVKPRIFLFGPEWNNLFNNLTDFMSPDQIKMITFCQDFEEFIKVF